MPPRLCLILALAVAVTAPSSACTTILVGKNASASGRVLVAHNEDDPFMLAVRHGVVPARDWPAGSAIPAEKGRAAVPQAAHTLAFYWSEAKMSGGGPSNADAFYNENGVYVVSNGAGATREDADTSLIEGGVEYNVRRIVAERAASARHAVELITNLVSRYGYAPGGRIYSVADRDEAWTVQIARGRNRYIACRVPDDEVAVIPNCFTAPGFAEAVQAPSRWRSPKDIYRWKYALLALCGGVWTDDRYAFSAKPAARVTVAALEHILSSHYEDSEELIAIPEYKINEAKAHRGQVVTICTANTIESTVCAFADDARETVIHVARGQGCCHPYEPVKPFASPSGPEDFWCGINAAWRLDNHLRRMTPREVLTAGVANGTVAGAVSVTSDASGTQDAVCVGFADKSSGRKMSMETLFALYSTSKSVCGAAVAILVDEGRLSLDDPVARYLPEFGNVKVEEPAPAGCGARFVPPKRPIAVRDLLCHQSGCRLYVPLAHRAVPLREVARLVAKTPLKTHPGECFWYNNPAIDTAGAVVEAVAGMPYETFLETRLFRPLGMTDTTFFPDAGQIARLARCYVGSAGGVVDVSETGAFERQVAFPAPGKVYACPSAGLYSTPRDFIRFAQMLANHGTWNGTAIISRKTFDATLAAKQTAPGIDTPYSLGNRLRPGAWIGHSGTLRTDFGADIATGRARLFFVQAGLATDAAFAELKQAWEDATAVP